MAARVAASSTMTKRHGWLKPTDGARLASSIKESKMPLGNGSCRKHRTSRRQIRSSRKRARNAGSKLVERCVAPSTCGIEFALMSESLAVVAEGIHRNVQALPIFLIGRQAETQPRRVVRKIAHQNSGAAEVMEQRRRCRRPRQPEQCRTARNAKAGTYQNGVEPSGRLQQPMPRLFDPRRIRQGRRAYGQCRAGNRPWPKHRRKPGRRWLVEQRETEPYSGKCKKLAERAQHHEIAAAHIAGETEAGWSDIRERLVDHENAAAGTQLCGEDEQRFPFDESAI